MNRLRIPLAQAGLILLALVGALAVMATGPLAVAPDALLAAVIGTGSPEAELALALRGPRLLAALTCGAALAGAGAGFQILFRNPLAAPDLLGVSSGAGLGAALALLLGAGAALVQGAAFAGGLAAGGLALACAALTRSGDGRLALILCGVVAGGEHCALFTATGNPAGSGRCRGSGGARRGGADLAGLPAGHSFTGR